MLDEDEVSGVRRRWGKRKTDHGERTMGRVLFSERERERALRTGRKRDRRWEEGGHWGCCTQPRC